MVLCGKNRLSLVSVKTWSWAAKGLRRNKKSPAKHPANPFMFSREPLMRMARFGPVCCVYCCAERTCCYKNSEKPSWTVIGQQRPCFPLQWPSQNCDSLDSFLWWANFLQRKVSRGKSSKKRLVRVSWEISRKNVKTPLWIHTKSLSLPGWSTIALLDKTDESEVGGWPACLSSHRKGERRGICELFRASRWSVCSAEIGFLQNSLPQLLSANTIILSIHPLSLPISACANTKWQACSFNSAG